MTSQTKTAVLPGLRGRHVLISMGPMRTPLDPVRYIQNRSSGKMGSALARACAAAGASGVSVLLGPVSSDIRRELAGFEIVDYEGPQEYLASLERMFPQCGVFFSAAAVLDFETIPSEKKIERAALAAMKTLDVAIRPVPDFVAQFGARKTAGQSVVAFAAETGTEAEILERAERKRVKKFADVMIANPVWPGLGPESDRNQVWILRPEKGVVALGPAPKEELAPRILGVLFGA
jgi:phosphopantothenoylcysteine decarboxylase/phosphopantothenate--cysteine ligase